MPRATLSFVEFAAADSRRLAEFFRVVFGWDSIDVPWTGPRYVRLLPPESGELSGAGILEPDASGLIDRLTIMVRIEGESLEDVLARAAAAGGAVALAPTAIGESGTFARLFDPEGNSIGLWLAPEAR